MAAFQAVAQLAVDHLRLAFSGWVSCCKATPDSTRGFFFGFLDLLDRPVAGFLVLTSFWFGLFFLLLFWPRFFGSWQPRRVGLWLHRNRVLASWPGAHRCPVGLIWLKHRGRFLVYLVVQSTTRAIYFCKQDTYASAASYLFFVV